MVGSEPAGGNCTSDLPDSAIDKLSKANSKLQGAILSGVGPDQISKLLSTISGEISDVDSMVSSVSCFKSDDSQNLLHYIGVILGSYLELMTQSQVHYSFEECPTCFSEFNDVNSKLSSLMKSLDSKLENEPCLIDCAEVSSVNGYIFVFNSLVNSIGKDINKDAVNVSRLSACKSTPSTCSRTSWTSVFSVPCSESSLITGTITATGRAEATSYLHAGTRSLKARAAPTLSSSSSVKNGTDTTSVTSTKDSGSALKPAGLLAVAGLAIAALI